MRILIGSIIVNDSKDYAVPFFERMVEDLLPDVDVVVATDDSTKTSLPTIDLPLRSHWATEICAHGHRALAKYALDEGYDVLVRQGIDCYYASRLDFNRLVHLAETRANYVGGLVAGRDMPDYPVCREFVVNGGVTTQERELPKSFFEAMTSRRVYGYIGSDATFISRRLLEEVDMSCYEHWHERTARGDHALGPDEWFVYRMLKQNLAVPVVHTGVRPWHLHQTMSAVRYRGFREQWTSETRPWA